MMGTDSKAQVPTLPAAWPRSHWLCSSLLFTYPASTRASHMHRCTHHLPPCTRGEVPVGVLPLLLPRNTGANLCLHPGHGHRSAPHVGTHLPLPPRGQHMGQSLSSYCLILSPTLHPACARESSRRTEEGWGVPSPLFPHAQACWAGDGAEAPN